jgi:hypothetical protein
MTEFGCFHALANSWIAMMAADFPTPGEPVKSYIIKWDLTYQPLLSIAVSDEKFQIHQYCNSTASSETHVPRKNDAAAH